MKKIKKQLLYLAIAEFAALCTFALLYRVLNPGIAGLIAFSYLILILLQGSIYWFYRYLLIIQKGSFNLKVIKLLRFLRPLNIILLVGISIIIPIIKSNNTDLTIAIGTFLFGIIEYINYYWYRLSYGRSGFNVKLLLSTPFKKSSISKMIKKRK